MNTLFVTEISTICTAVAEVLHGAKTRGEGCIKVGENTVVTWVPPYLLRLKEPDEISDAYKKWNEESLPILPETIDFIAIDDAGARKQLKTLLDLIKDATRIVHAGDAGREGQLIIDLILNKSGFKGDISRLWLNANDEQSVRTALKSMRPNSEYRGLFDAGKARAYVDWYIGMNLTRSYTLAGKKSGYPNVISVGRVQTPTLTLVVARDLGIEQFVAKDHYKGIIVFNVENGQFAAVWQPKPETDSLVDGMLLDREVIKGLFARLRGHDGIVKQVVKKVGKTNPPLPFRLSTLQKICSSRFKLSAAKTLEVAQKLYEEKLTSYPRTGSSHLKESSHSEGTETLAAIGENLPAISGLCRAAIPSIKSPAWDDNKVGEHHGIIPTRAKKDISGLSPIERDVYELICRRYIAQFYPAAENERTKIEVELGGESFVARGSVELVAGWKLIERSEEKPEATDTDDEDSQALPPVTQGEPAKPVTGSTKSLKTKPRTPYNDGSLIEAMEAVHNVIKSGELDQIDAAAKHPDVIARLKETAGLGTDATRASIIETLLSRGFIKRDGNKLISTEAGRDLIAALPTQVKSPVLSSLLEQELESIRTGDAAYSDFLAKMRDWTKKLTTDCLSTPLKIAMPDGSVRCPLCGNGTLLKRSFVRKSPENSQGGKSNQKDIIWGCSTFPNCKARFPDKRGKPDIPKA